MSKPTYYIKENSWQAKLAAKRMGSSSIAMVLGSTIHLYAVSKSYFLNDTRWLKHELCHVQQFNTHGYVAFFIKYIWEWFKVGYHNNKYEVEARAAEEVA